MNQYDQLKNSLHNYKVAVDKDKLWENTSHAIPRKRRRRAVPLLLLGVLVIAGWLFYANSIRPLSESMSTLRSDEILNSVQISQNMHGDPSANREASNNSLHKTIEVLSSKLSRSAGKLFSENNEQSANHITKPETTGTKPFAENNTADIESVKLPPIINTVNDNFPNNQSASLIEKENTEGPKVSIVNVKTSNQQENTFAVIQQTENNSNYTDRIANGPVDFLFKDLSQIPATTNAVETTSSFKPNIQPQKDHILQSFQLVQGVGFSTMKIHSLAPESDEFATLLKQKMRSLEILTTSATLTGNLPGMFSLETGIQFSRLSTVIDHEWETSERIQQEGITTIIIDENGIPQSITGNTGVTQTTHYHAKRYTEHKQIEVVMSLQRAIWKAQRLSLSAFVKGNYRLSYEAEGTTLDYDGELLGFSKAENPFRQNSPFRLGGGLQLNYRLDRHWNIISNLTYDQISYQLTDPTMPLRLQHSGLSFGLGIGYGF